MAPHNRVSKEESVKRRRWEKKKEKQKCRRKRDRGRERETEQSDRSSLLPAGLARRGRPCRAAARSVNVFSFFLALSFPSCSSHFLFLSPSSPSSPSIVSSRSLHFALSHAPLAPRSLSSLAPHQPALPCCIAHTRHGCLRNPSVILRTARPRPGLSRAVRDREGISSSCPSGLLTIGARNRMNREISDIADRR